MKRLLHFIVTNYKFKIWQLTLFYFETRKVCGSYDGSDEFQSVYHSRSAGSFPGEVLIWFSVQKITPMRVLYKQEFSGILLLVIIPPLLHSPAPPLFLTVIFHCCFTLIYNRPTPDVHGRPHQPVPFYNLCPLYGPL